MSPMTFRYRDTFSATNGDTISNLFCKAKNLSRHPAAADFFAAPLCVHDNAAMLSLMRPTCLQQRFWVPMIPSNTSPSISFPDISRLFIAKLLPGFLNVISLSRIFFGHSKHQIVGSSSSFPDSQPPPTPSADASTQTRNLGSPMTNSFAVVGSRVASFSIVLQYRNSCFVAGKYFHQNIHGFTCKFF